LARTTKACLTEVQQFARLSGLLSPGTKLQRVRKHPIGYGQILTR
jgi:hypothetical protein